MTVRHSRCHLADAAADARFAATLTLLSQGKPSAVSRIGFRTGTGSWQVSVAALPIAQPAGGRLILLPPERLVLVQILEFGSKGLAAEDLAPLAPAFGLTPSEVALCRRLLLGESLVDAAEQLGISQETARTRLKTIFQKTGTSRQAELMLLLARAS